MAGNSEVSQVVRLNTTQYRTELEKVQTDTRTNLQKINKALVDSGKSFGDFTNVVKKSVSSIINSFEEVGKSFAKNLGKGALVGGTILGVDAMREGAKEAVRTGLAFEDALARIASRADLSAKQVSKLKQEFFELGKTGAKLDSIPEAFNAIYGATGSMEQSKAVMEPIAKAAAMGNGDAGQVADFVKDRLKGEGKEINKTNVTDLLQAVNLAQRSGEFNSMGEAMQGMQGVDAAAQRRAGLSDKDLAGILAGSTRAGADKATGVAAAQAVIHMGQQGFGGGAALGGMLGVGSFMKDGKFDTSKLTAAAAHLKKSGRSDAENVELFKSAGLSEQESTGLLAILKNITKFNEGVKRVATDTKTFEQSFEEVTDTLSHRLEELKNATVAGFDDIFSPLMRTVKQAAGGHYGDAAKGLPGALFDSAKGVAAHPLLAGGGLLATAAGGALLKKLGLGEGKAKLGEGLAKGKALQGAGVTPVYVVNFGEVGEASKSDTGGFFDKTEKLAGGAGTAAGGAVGLGIGTLAAGAGAAGLALVVAQQMRIANEKDPKKQKQIADSGDNGFGNAAGQGGGIQADLQRLLVEWLSGNKNQKVQVEVMTKDPGIMANPKKTDNARDPKGF